MSSKADRLASNRACMQKLTAYRVEHHLCVKCGEPARENRRMCLWCSEKENARMRRRWADRSSNGSVTDTK